MSERIEFDVWGTPRPGGSKKGFYIPGRGGSKGHVVITDDAGQGNIDWRQAVVWACREARGEAPLLNAPLAFCAVFRFPRPKWHFRGGDRARPLKPTASPWHLQDPDLTKLIRSTEDALTGVLYVDDNRIQTDSGSLKRWCNPGERPGATITVTVLRDPAPQEAAAARETDRQASFA